MNSNSKSFSLEPVKRHYDNYAGRQDNHAWYEDAAIDVMLNQIKLFEGARVFELGCGTGRFAERILSENDGIFYSGVDLSSTMLALTEKRTSRFRNRVSLKLADEHGRIHLPDTELDFFFNNYVCNLLAKDQLYMVLHEAWRTLKTGGHLCLTNVTDGTTATTRLYSLFWKLVRTISPKSVGWCRPIAMRHYISPFLWRELHYSTVQTRGVVSEVLILERTEDQEQKQEQVENAKR